MIGTRFRLDFIDFAEKIKKSTNFKIAKYVEIKKTLPKNTFERFPKDNHFGHHKQI